MGFTPLEGLVMGTRSGSIDPGVFEHISKCEKKGISEIVKILNHDSGLKGLCGTSDMRDIMAKIREGDEKAQLAFEIFCYSIRKFIGEYFVVLGCQVDAIVFTGGIGENSAEVRSAVLSNLEPIGVKLDEEKNHYKMEEQNEINDEKSEKSNGVWQISKEVEIPSELGKIKKCLVVCTNEELEIARQVVDSLTERMSARE